MAQTCRGPRGTMMENKKEEALDLLNEMRGFIGLHLNSNSDVMYKLYNMVDDLKDVIHEIDVCKCSMES